MLILWTSIFFAISAFVCIASAATTQTTKSPLTTTNGPPKIGESYDAKVVDFPYTVSVQTMVPKSKSFVHSCGGSIISPTFILTAAFCVTKNPQNTTFKIAAEAQEKFTGGSIQSITVAKKIIHPNFTSNTSSNDIALLELAKPLNMTSLSKMVLLPKARTKVFGQAVFSGWGSISTNLKKVLQTATVPILSVRQCSRLLNKQQKIKTTKVFSLERNICTGPLSGSKTSCSVDIGGPLVKNRMLVGIASWMNDKCGSANQPLVYTNVAEYIDFIEKNVYNLPSIA